ncbi:MAG: hypothetical protein JXL67_12365 [Calditrichaeota bacterium]|nr:hypothetical protein [Calditrichota bacterium]
MNTKYSNILPIHNTVLKGQLNLTSDIYRWVKINASIQSVPQARNEKKLGVHTRKQSKDSRLPEPLRPCSSEP